MNIRHLLAVSLLAVQAACAQTPVRKPAPEVPRTLEQADAQRARAKEMQDEAEQRYVREKAACYRKFLVNGCLEDARRRHTEALIEARQLDIPAREFQRDARRADVAAKEEKRAADLVTRTAEQEAQAETYRQTEAKKKAERDAERAAKKAREDARIETENAAKATATDR